MSRHWMPLYIADYLKDTTHLGALESGAYLHLIMDYWQNGKLPTDDKSLARIAKLTSREWKRLKSTLQSFFYEGWRHKRIDEELAHAADISAKRAAAAAAREAARAARSSGQDGIISSSNDPSSDDTVHSSQSTKKEKIGGARAPTYAFEGRIVRLGQVDFNRWKDTYSALPDITATLQAADDYYSENRPKDGKWFFPVSRWLQKEHDQIVASREKQRREARSF